MNDEYPQAAYEAYVKDCGGLSVHGEPLPSWQDQRPEIRDHWRAATAAVLTAAIGLDHEFEREHQP